MISCPIFGVPEGMRHTVLPTIEDVIKALSLTRNNLEDQSVNRNLLISKSSDIVAKQVEDIWKKAGIPIVSHQRIVELIKKYHTNRQKLLKPYKERKHVASYKSRLDSFKADCQRLFDIAACKCANFSLCVCGKPFKVGAHFFVKQYINCSLFL